MSGWLTIIALCGPIGSGKTTLAHRLHDRLRDARVISTDLLGRGAYAKMLGIVASQRGPERYLILDATFYRQVWRDRLAEAARERVVTVFLRCSLETSLRRNRERTVSLSDSAVYSIYRGFEAPSDADVVLEADRVTPEQAEGVVIRYINEIGDSP